MVPDFPNYFVTFGPYHPGNGSVFTALEYLIRYMIDVIKKSQIENIKAIAPRWSTTNKYREHCDLFLKRTVWNQNCKSQFKLGQVHEAPRLYAGSRTHFLEVLLKPRYEDFEIEYESDNPFEYFGNGFSTRDFDGTDSTWYLGLVDGIDHEPKYPDWSQDDKDNIVALKNFKM